MAGEAPKPALIGKRCHPERSEGPVHLARVISGLVFVALLSACGPPRADRIVIGSKNFTEQLVLGEIIAQQIENKTHLPVERRFYLAGSYICHQAILGGRIDIYPEYTGTALTAILKAQASRDPAQVYNQIKTEYAMRFNLEVGQTFGFNDTFAIEIRGEDARRLGLRTISRQPSTRRNGAPDSATNSWSAPMATKAWQPPTVCDSPSRLASWISVCSPAL